VAQNPIRTGAAFVAVFVAAVIALLIVIGEALVRLAARINDARATRR
jgi:hypothetical protein